MNKKICVYAICKNESQFVKRWYESVKEADYVCVLVDRYIVSWILRAFFDSRIICPTVCCVAFVFLAFSQRIEANVRVLAIELSLTWVMTAPASATPGHSKQKLISVLRFELSPGNSPSCRAIHVQRHISAELSAHPVRFSNVMAICLPCSSKPSGEVRKSNLVIGYQAKSGHKWHEQCFTT